jgi:hypothetical protein
MVVSLLTPLGLVGCSVLLWFAIAKGDQVVFKKGFLLTSILLIFLVLPSITNVTFESFKCTTLYDGNEYMDIDVSISCWEGEHLGYSLGVGLLVIFLWVIGLPVFAFFKLQSLREKR